MVKEIPLTQGQVALVDDCDFEWIMGYNWFADYDQHTKGWYAATNIGSRPNRTLLLMHRLIMDAQPGQRVDHVDHEGLHNNRGNLRFCSNSQNLANMRMMVTNTSGFKGVTFHRRDKVWQAQIKVNGKFMYIGSYHTAGEAADAYDKHALLYNGVFALTNAMLRGESVTA
jgi:hypothetical protein